MTCSALKRAYRDQLRAGHPVITLTKYRRLPGHFGSVTEFDHYIVLTGLATEGFGTTLAAIRRSAQAIRADASGIGEHAPHTLLSPTGHDATATPTKVATGPGSSR